MGISKKRYRKIKRIIEGGKYQLKYQFLKATSHDIKYFHENEWVDIDFTTSGRKEMNNKVQQTESFLEKYRKIKTLHDVVEFAFQHNKQNKLSASSLKHVFELKNKKKNFVIFDNAGGNIFEIFELKPEGVRSFMSSQIQHHVLAFRLNGKDVIFKRKFQNFMEMIPEKKRL